jgi:hypothetical protein
MAARDFMRTTTPCHIRTIKTGRMVYDYRRKTRYPSNRALVAIKRALVTTSWI